MDLNHRINRSRELQEKVNEATEEIQTIDTRLQECRRELQDLCETGPLPLNEAMEQFERALDEVSEEGRGKLHRKLQEFTRPRHKNPSLLSDRHRPAPSLASLISHQMYGARVVENHEPFIFLLRNAIHAEGKKVIEAACQGSNLPDEDKRYTIIDKLGREVADLEAEKEQLQRHISDLVQQVARLLDTSKREAGVYAGQDEHAELD